jgi:flagellar biosynthesis/type III secretory pathway protein FliH
VASEAIQLLQPLLAVRIDRDGPPPPTPAQIEERERAAYQKGYDDASVSINRQILEQRADANHMREHLFRALEQAAASAAAEVRSVLPYLTIQALRRVIARVEVTRETVEGVIHELLAEIGPDVGPVELRLHPADLRLVQDLEPNLAGIHPGLRLVGDESLARGDAQAATRFGKVDARLENKLARLGSALTGH